MDSLLHLVQRGPKTVQGRGAYIAHIPFMWRSITYMLYILPYNTCLLPTPKKKEKKKNRPVSYTLMDRFLYVLGRSYQYSRVPICMRIWSINELVQTEFVQMETHTLWE